MAIFQKCKLNVKTYPDYSDIDTWTVWKLCDRS